MYEKVDVQCTFSGKMVHKLGQGDRPRAPPLPHPPSPEVWDETDFALLVLATETWFK